MFFFIFFFFFKQKTAYEIPLCDWSSDVCSSDLARVDRDVRAQERRRLGERRTDGADITRDGLAQAERARAEEPARLAVVLGPGPEALGQQAERVGLRDGAVEVAEDVQHGQRGNASGTPPSTGSVAPVVGVRLEAKNTTALPTCSAVTVAFSRFRCR